MSVQTEIDRIIGLVDDSHEAVKAKGGTTSTPYLLANLPEAIESIPEGVDVSNDTVTPTTMLEGTTAHDKDGNPIEGTIVNQGSATRDVSRLNYPITLKEGYYTEGDINVITEFATVTPKNERQYIYPNLGFFEQITVEPIPSNYEDVTDETTAYTTKLAELETAMNELNTELDGKAAGSGSAVETCTVTVNDGTANVNAVYATIYDGNSIATYAVGDDATIPTIPLVVENVVCNSSIVILSDNGSTGYSSVSGGVGKVSFFAGRSLVFSAPSAKDAAGVITVNQLDI